MNSETVEFIGSSMSDRADPSLDQTGKKKILLCTLYGLKRSGRETKVVSLPAFTISLAPFSCFVATFYLLPFTSMTPRCQSCLV
jgi:hypothetical protein